MAHNGRDGLTRISAHSYDLVLLDVMMPVIDGMTVLQQMRKKTDMPVIMLTARVERKDRVEGLNAGADDYVPKPFDADELLARIRAVLRRTERVHARATTVTSVGALLLNSATREVRLAGLPVDLTSIEFDILELWLAQQAGWSRGMRSPC